MKKHDEKEAEQTKETPILDVLENKLASAVRLVEEKLVQMGVDLTGKKIIISGGKITIKENV